MSDGHERFQRLAVGHVLGGLDADDAAAFRSHLHGCRSCRARVVELRGIASDLERAERDERARSMVRTEVARRPPETEAPQEVPRPRIGLRHVTIAVVVVAVMAGAMAFWNLHLRTSNAVVGSVAEQHTETLRVLADGVPADLEAEHPVRGVAAVDGERVAVALGGVELVDDGERVVLWLRGEQGHEPAAQVLARQLADGHLALSLEDEDADELIVTAERGELDDEPRGTVLARVELRAPR
jgi:anti-sigma factor RsiW